MSGWSSKASDGVERRRGRGLKARGGRRETPGKVLKDRRSQRRRGRMGIKCIERAFRIPAPALARDIVPPPPPRSSSCAPSIASSACAVLVGDPRPPVIVAIAEAGTPPRSSPPTATSRNARITSSHSAPPLTRVPTRSATRSSATTDPSTTAVGTLSEPHAVNVRRESKSTPRCNSVAATSRRRPTRSGALRVEGPSFKANVGVELRGASISWS